MTAFVPRPAAVRITIRARQTCFCGLFRSRTIASSRSRSALVSEIEIPGRMPQTRTCQTPGESPAGPKRQISSTSSGSFAARPYTHADKLTGFAALRSNSAITSAMVTLTGIGDWARAVPGPPPVILLDSIFVSQLPAPVQISVYAHECVHHVWAERSCSRLLGGRRMALRNSGPFLSVALQIQQRETLPDLHEGAVQQILLAPDQPLRDIPLGYRIVVLIVEQRCEGGGPQLRSRFWMTTCSCRISSRDLAGRTSAARPALAAAKHRQRTKPTISMPCRMSLSVPQKDEPRASTGFIIDSER
jgi:hypothetical protein